MMALVVPFTNLLRQFAIKENVSGFKRCLTNLKPIYSSSTNLTAKRFKSNIESPESNFISIGQEPEPEPSYECVNRAEEIVYYHNKPYRCHYGGILPDLQLAYECWGTLNAKKDNVVLLQHGLSGSSHVRSHDEYEGSAPGWWQKFVGANKMIDTNKFFVICVNHLGSCFGSTGPSSYNPITERPYGGDFPIVSIKDICEAQVLVLDYLGIDKLYAVVGASLGGMAAFWLAAQFPDRVSRMVSISGGGNASPQAIAFRYLQRDAIMKDPNWRNGNYYGLEPPVQGMQLARKIATLTYRSGPEWSKRFDRKKINQHVHLPRYTGSEFAIEDYIRHQGESFLEKTGYDPNSLIYLSKAMDLFDMGDLGAKCKGLRDGFCKIKCPTLVMGASSDVLFPSRKQEEAAQLITESGNRNVVLNIVDGHYGHDTFLLDLEGMGMCMKDFLENYCPR